MDISTRPETPNDYKTVSAIIKAAFEKVELSDQTEHLLVERLRNSDAYIAELSLVAEYENQLIGHILISKIEIKNESESYSSLSLAPVSVLPAYQSKGVGSALIKSAHAAAKELGYESIVLIGHENYYPRFGYQKASDFGIAFPFEAPDQNCMAIELEPAALSKVNGVVVYPPAFMG